MCLNTVTFRGPFKGKDPQMAYKVVRKASVYYTELDRDLLLPGMHAVWGPSGEEGFTVAGKDGKVIRHPHTKSVLIERDDGHGHRGTDAEDQLDGREVYWWVNPSTRVECKPSYLGECIEVEFDSTDWNKCSDKMNSDPKYHMGFHAYRTLEGAIANMAGGEFIVKVELRGIICYGEQGMTACVVAREMRIVEEVQ